MEFSFTDEQQMLLDTTRRLLTEQYGFERRQQILGSSAGYSDEIWARFADLGLLGLNVPAEHGGIEAGPIGTLLVSIALGEALVVEPFLSSAVLATRAIAKLGSPAQQAEFLPRLAIGELICVLAHDEESTRCGATGITAKATPCRNGWSLSGHKTVIYHAPIADLLLVSAVIGDASAGEWGLFAVPRASAGLELQIFTTVDGQRAADLILREIKVPVTSRLGENVASELPKVLDYGLAALCAESVGALDKLLSATIEYSRTRVQFGVPIARFQALQHRMADMLTHIEQARSMAYLAASHCEEEHQGERERSLSAAKVILGQAARFVGQQAVQLHGGMGVSDEFCVSHYFKRLLASELRFGSTDAHLGRYASSLMSC